MELPVEIPQRVYTKISLRLKYLIRSKKYDSYIINPKGTFKYTASVSKMTEVKSKMSLKKKQIV